MSLVGRLVAACVGSQQQTGVPMPVEFASGELFANTYVAQAFAHGCNCQGVTGAGIAVGFRERYPEMYEQYRARYRR